MPVSSYLIDHPKGLILIDTGWHEEMRVKQRKHLGRLAYSMFQGELPEGQSIAEQLHSLGINSKDIDLVILSHMHSDHVSGLRHVQDAKRIMTSELEWQAAHRRLGYIKSMWQGIDVDTFSFTDIPYGPFNKGYDVFGDHSLYAVHTPGHSDGMVSFMIKMDHQWLLLASDVGYSSKSWMKMVLPGITTDRKAAYQSLRWLKEFAKQKDCRRIIVNHDPEVKPEVII